MQATQPSLRRVAIDPISRVEGHGKITLLLDDANHVQEARLHIVEFRGFEKFIQGRPYTEVPYFVQRLCGICPVSHHLAAAKAVDQLVGVDETKLRPNYAACCILPKCCNRMRCTFSICPHRIFCLGLAPIWRIAILSVC